MSRDPRYHDNQQLIFAAFIGQETCTFSIQDYTSCLVGRLFDYKTFVLFYQQTFYFIFSFYYYLFIFYLYHASMQRRSSFHMDMVQVPN